MPATRQLIGFLTGLKAEAACLGPPDAVGRVAISAGDPARAHIAAGQLADDGATALVSVGMAGGLDPAQRPGDLVVGSAVALPDGRVIAADRSWWPRILAVLADAAGAAPGRRPKVLVGTVYGSDAAILETTHKLDLRTRTGAIAVDLESAAVACLAAERGLPFAVVRAIADPADRPVPALSLAGMGADGTMRPWPVIRRLIVAPQHLPALVRLGIDTRRSLAALRAVPWGALVSGAGNVAAPGRGSGLAARDPSRA
jgi:nucleoside phosphorylase